MGARYYDGRLGRFTSQDPIFQATGDSAVVKAKSGMNLEDLLADPQMLNSYSYARNNPIKNIDPTGNVSVSALLTNPFSTLAQLAVWRAGSEYLSDSRPASSALMNHSLSVNPKNISIGAENQSNYGNIIDQIKNSPEFNNYLNNALTQNQDNIFSENGLSGSLEFSSGDLSTSLGKAGIVLSGDGNGISVQIKDKYNYEMHANSAAYKDSMFFTTLNNMANVSEKLETITPYTTTIKFNTKIKKDD